MAAANPKLYKKLHTGGIELSKEQGPALFFVSRKVEIEERHFGDGIGGTCHWLIVSLLIFL